MRCPFRCPHLSWGWKKGPSHQHRLSPPPLAPCHAAREGPRTLGWSLSWSGGTVAESCRGRNLPGSNLATLQSCRASPARSCRGPSLRSSARPLSHILLVLGLNTSLIALDQYPAVPPA